ncbi:MAG: glycosyltransferase family 2 protein [Alphaproteobacteria bacterium]
MINPKVSVIIPVYNGSAFLRRGLDNLVCQTLKDIEIICVNDCSTDNSLDILQEYAHKDKRFKIMNIPQNGGQGIAKNAALENASGEYIMFMDQDDWFEPDACELAYNQAHRNGNDLVLFDFSYCYDFGYYKRNQKMIKPFLPYLAQPNIKLYRLKFNWLISGWAWCYIYKKKFLDDYKIRFWVNARYVDDTPFICQALVFADTFSVINKSLYVHFENTQSVTYTRNDLWYEHLIGDKILQYVESSGHAEAFRPVFTDYLARKALHWYKFYSRDENWKSKWGRQYYKKMKSFFTAMEKKYQIGSQAGFLPKNIDKFYDIQELSAADLEHVGAKGSYITINLFNIEVYKTINAPGGGILLYLFNFPFFACCPNSDGTKMYYLFGVPVIGTTV